MCVIHLPTIAQDDESSWKGSDVDEKSRQVYRELLIGPHIGFKLLSEEWDEAVSVDHSPCLVLIGTQVDCFFYASLNLFLD